MNHGITFYVDLRPDGILFQEKINFSFYS